MQWVCLYPKGLESRYYYNRNMHLLSHLLPYYLLWATTHKESFQLIVNRARAGKKCPVTMVATHGVVIRTIYFNTIFKFSLSSLFRNPTPSCQRSHWFRPMYCGSRAPPHCHPRIRGNRPQCQRDCPLVWRQTQRCTRFFALPNCECDWACSI